MSRRERSQHSAEPGARLRRRREVFLVTLALLVVIVVVAVFGRGLPARFARHVAARRVGAGAISAAQRWVAWSARLDPNNGETELVRAACFRHLGEVERFVEALRRAERLGTPRARVQREMKLGLIQAGQFDRGIDRELGPMTEAGISPHEVAAAYVHGFLVRDEPDEAKRVLEAWSADFPDEAQVAYMAGIYWLWLDDPGRAEEELEVALAREPRHELARTALAELIEEQDRLEEALERYAEAAARSAASEAAHVGMARLLRKLGCLDAARAALEPLASRPEASSAVAVEMGEIELESGDYAEAARWFRHVDLDATADRGLLRAAATLSALEGEVPRADRLFGRADAEYRRVLRIDELRARLKIDPGDRKAHDELQRAFRAPVAARANGTTPRTERPTPDRPADRATSASELYALHCGACHGDDGRGDGRAARHLFPRPRDLRAEKYRLVSAPNGVPTLGDCEAVIRRGMPGTSMAPLEDLRDDERRILAEEVLRLRREGVREQFIRAMLREGEEIDDDEVREVVEFGTTPGEPVPVPPMGPADAPSLARGKGAYFNLGCDKCHGNDGAGAWEIAYFDERGLPAPPRDLVHEPFKGGREPESIYLRVYVGMPGSPHPGCWNVPESRLVDLVQYCRGLAREPERVLTNHERAMEAARYARASTFGGSGGR